MKFCVYCGTHLKSEDMFCKGCGKSTIAEQTKGDVPQSLPVQNNTPSKPQQYTSPVPPRQYTSPVPPQQFAGPNKPLQPYSPPPQQYPDLNQPQQHYGAPPQQYASPSTPQPRPGGNNPFTQFSEEMNTGNIQKRTGGRGMLLSGIIALVVLTLIVGGILVGSHLKNASKEDDDNPKKAESSASTRTQAPNDDEQAEGKVKGLVIPKNTKNNATLEEVAGYWNGTISFIRMDGYENIPADQLPPDTDVKAIVAEIMAAPAPIELELELDGNWELEIDIVMGMILGSRDYDHETSDISPLLINGLKNGSFDINHSEQIDEDGVKGKSELRLSGTVVEDKDGLSIIGTFLVTMTQDDIVITQEGTYTVYPKEDD